MREFETGATRDDDSYKPDYEGYLSPLVIEEFGRFMTRHRKQKDGKMRDSDNWQKGIPLDAYIKSAWRHFHEVWMHHRGYPAKNAEGEPVDLKEAWCALLFNVQGYLHETLKKELDNPQTVQYTVPKPGKTGPSDPEKEKGMVGETACPGRSAMIHERRIVGVRLADMGCTSPARDYIVGGMRFPIGKSHASIQTAYISGPMRGYANFNFPAFDYARNTMLRRGWATISPADIDRAAGDASDADDPDVSKRYVYRDFYSLFLLSVTDGDAIVMLRGWEKSTGATAEFFLARWLGLTILDHAGRPLDRFYNDDLNTAIRNTLWPKK